MEVDWILFMKRKGSEGGERGQEKIQGDVSVISQWIDYFAQLRYIKNPLKKWSTTYTFKIFLDVFEDFVFILNCMYMNVYVWVSVCGGKWWGQKRVLDPLELVVVGYGCWGHNLDFLEEQHKPLTAEPPVQPPFFLIVIELVFPEGHVYFERTT